MQSIASIDDLFLQSLLFSHFTGGAKNLYSIRTWSPRRGLDPNTMINCHPNLLELLFVSFLISLSVKQKKDENGGK